MPRCTPALPPLVVSDAALRALPLRIPTEVTWLRVLAPPPEDAGSVLLDCMQCALEEAPPLPELPADPPPPLPGITRVTMRRVEVWNRGQCSAWWLGQCRDCLTVYWCDDRGAETWPTQGWRAASGPAPGLGFCCFGTMGCGRRQLVFALRARGFRVGWHGIK